MVRRIVENNAKARAENLQLTARVIADIQNNDDVSSIDNELAERLAKLADGLLPEEGKNEQLGGSSGDGGTD